VPPAAARFLAKIMRRIRLVSSRFPLTIFDPAGLAAAARPLAKISRSSLGQDQPLVPWPRSAARPLAKIMRRIRLVSGRFALTIFDPAGLAAAARPLDGVGSGGRRLLAISKIETLIPASETRR
jgi:hypothetical protein